MHGKDTDPNKKWYPWFAKELKKFNLEIIIPALPKSSDPIIEEWTSEIGKTSPDSNTILIGHSRSGVAIMRWLEEQNLNKKIKKVILIATNSGKLKDKAIKSESNYGFYTNNGYDFKKIKKHCQEFIIFHSKDDKWVPFSTGIKNAKGLEAKFYKFNNYGHFGKGIEEIPELLEKVIDFDVRKSLLIPINSKNQILIQDRRGFKKPDWGFFGGKIEKDETPIKALVREIKEELDINIKKKDVKYIGSSTAIWDDYKIIRYIYLYPTKQKDFNVYEGKGAYWMSFNETRKKLDDKDRFNELVNKISKNHNL